MPPKNSEPVQLPSLFLLSEKIKDILVEQGFSETSLYAFVQKGSVKIERPLAADKGALRENLSENIRTSLTLNTYNAYLLGLDIIKIFEIGKVFSIDANGVHQEKTFLGLGISQVQKNKKIKAEDILKSTIEQLSKEWGITISASTISSEGSTIAWTEISLDDIAPLTAGKISYADLNFNTSSSNKYQKISPYPFIVRDVAVFVPETVQSSEVWNVIKSAIISVKADALLVRYSLFDTFKKEGKVSYAFRMVFQSMEKTLTDDEINVVMTAMYEALKGKGWEVR